MIKVDVEVTMTFTVKGRVVPGHAPITSGPPDNWDPGDNDEFYLESVTVDGVEVPPDLWGPYQEQIEEAALEHYYENGDPEDEDR